MKPTVRRTAQAQRDIDAIADWIARDSVDSAIKWLNGIDIQLKSIALTPGMGTDRSYLRSDLRSSPHGNYVIFFRPSRNGIVVIRVIHGARDYESIIRKRQP